jgi:hypothetical protein
MDAIIAKLANAAKAIVGAATPIITAVVTEVVADLSVLATSAIAAGATALLVYLTPNKDV